MVASGSPTMTAGSSADPRPRPQWSGGTSNRTVNGSYHRPVHFDQAMVRRAAIAIGENWSNDTFKLAAVALRAAIRNEGDLLALLPATPVTPVESPSARSAIISEPAVCTENLIRVDDVMESPKLAE